jgi:protein-L-isoaspartate O-methyltransferase
VPRFFAVRSAARGEVGHEELRAAYDGVHAHYDDFWLAEAAGPIHALVDEIRWSGKEQVFEAGCGTGYATSLLARRAGSVVAADISSGMLEEARRRLERDGRRNVRLLVSDAIAALKAAGAFDLVFTTWVLGYLPLAPFFSAAAAALAQSGRLALVVHRENSPREPLEIFAELVARDPSVLQKRVAFDFPQGASHLQSVLTRCGFTIEMIREGSITFRYASADDVLEHLLKSGAGTAFYEAIDPVRRESLAREFVAILSDRDAGRAEFDVTHEYVACIAQKAG